MDLTVDISHNAADFNHLREEWQALQVRSGARGVCLTWEWVTTWWEHFGADKQLWLLQARDAEGQLVGLGTLILSPYQPHIGSFEGRTWQQLEFIGSRQNCEHLGFLTESGSEAAIIQALIQALAGRQREWDVLHLAGLAEGSATLAALRSLEIPWESGPRMIAPFIPLRNDWEEYFSRLGSDKRKVQRKRLRILDRDYPERWSFKQVMHEHELRPAWEKLVELHQAAWEGRGEEGAFGDLGRRAFLFSLAQRFLAAGWLRMYSINLDDEPAAILYSFEFRGRVYDFVSGVDWDYRKYNVGHVLTQLAIHRAVDRGVDEYDFLWGDEPYKYEWRAQSREHLTLIWFASPVARFQHVSFKTVRKAKYRARKLLHSLKPGGSSADIQDPDIE